VKNYHFENNDILVVRFDDKITNLNAIVKTLKKKGEKVKDTSISGE